MNITEYNVNGIAIKAKMDNFGDLKVECKIKFKFDGLLIHKQYNQFDFKEINFEEIKKETLFFLKRRNGCKLSELIIESPIVMLIGRWKRTVAKLVAERKIVCLDYGVDSFIVEIG